MRQERGPSDGLTSGIGHNINEATGGAIGKVEAMDDGMGKDLREKLLQKDDSDADRLKRDIAKEFNWAVLLSWPIFAAFLLSQPWTSNYLNNMWASYSADYIAFGDNGSVVETKKRAGMCITPADEMICTDGQNFTALAIAARGAPIGCGCGQGVLGEGLCPMTSYGYTLSDFVSTGPAIAMMLGSGFFPLLGTWVNTMQVNESAKPSFLMGWLHYLSMVVFQVSYIAWSVAADCIFPTWHAILTVLFLGSFLAHWVITACICYARFGMSGWQSKITFMVAISAIVIITLGAVPRVFLTLNLVLDTTTFPNWNRGIGSYAFWFAEAMGLTLTFGAYPMVLIAYFFTDSIEEAEMELSTQLI